MIDEQTRNFFPCSDALGTLSSCVSSAIDASSTTRSSAERGCSSSIERGVLDYTAATVRTLNCYTI